MSPLDSPPAASGETQSVHKHMVRGSAWAVAMRWSMRGIGLVSTIILARLLTPEDFGIVAMAMITYGLVIAFSELGAEMLIIRMPNPDRMDYNTAWTFRLLQRLVIAGFLLAIAPLAARYFGEPGLIQVIIAVSGIAAFSGLVNIGMVQVRKELDFAKDFRFELYTRLSSFVITIAAAIILRSYWALVIGQAGAEISRVIISYLMHSFRPRLTLARWRNFLTFSTDILVSSIGKYFNERFDSIIVGGVAGTQVLGVYNLSSELSHMFATEVVKPVGRALLPTFSTIATKRDKLAETFLDTVGLVAALVIPMGFGLAAIANEFVSVVLGPNWIEAVPYLQWLGPYAAIGGLLTILSGQVLVVVGRQRLFAVLAWIRAGALALAALVAVNLFDIQSLVVAITLTSAVMLLVFSAILTTALPVSLLAVLNLFWRSFAAAFLMLFVLNQPFAQVANPAAGLALKIGLGATVVVASHYVLWLIVGSPRGPERTILNLLKKLAVKS